MKMININVGDRLNLDKDEDDALLGDPLDHTPERMAEILRVKSELQINRIRETLDVLAKIDLASPDPDAVQNLAGVLQRLNKLKETQEALVMVGAHLFTEVGRGVEGVSIRQFIVDQESGSITELAPGTTFGDPQPVAGSRIGEA